VFDFRPKAILKPKITPQPVKPYIAQGIGSLNRVAGINKGAAALEADTVLDYAEGDRVRHVKYGEGTVSKIEREPRDYKVTVHFDNAGQKIMYASFAKLKRV
jgi:DNA helicase-2/ATP-dependent DNA helicase PcrA